MKIISLFKEESHLISRAAKNSREAQQELYEKYSGKMLSVCRLYIKDLHHAEDVMLTGFFKVFTHLKDFKNEGSFEGWVRRIMIRESITFLRKQNKLEFRDEMIEMDGSNFNNINSNLEVSEIQKMIDSLPEGYRVIFVMFAIEGYKHSEIAETLNISEGTSKSQLFKARKMLQQKLMEQNTTGYGTT